MKFPIQPDPIPGGHAGIDARLKLGPRIHSTAYVVPNATVIGDVTLMEESSVWYGAVLRGDIIGSFSARALTSKTMQSFTSIRLTRRG
jgi:carbonic anhydrase/acetyltransferase-like protein (isoleucine patch superfamily)